ncbi:hypothetical protein QMK17_12120 [Rhodococcus sp. G-MC3]|uniref:hypothetical protein n=1 Tax=Rhodococcus sp. G-MC3 TaxID=3046209 RepID=UPI0024B98515|nr:hypothetical protein [Rhodococcus sp. G-MC3]MDJ0394074.1 hypothetical protein [Rhodococcus sp. G-MC3]
MPSVLRISTRRAFLLPVILAIVVLQATPAWGQDIDEPASGQPETGDGPEPTFSFGISDLGLGGSLPVYGVDGRTQITVPVPTGTAPTTFDAAVTIPAWLDRGWIDFESDGRPISRLVLAQDAASMPVSIPLGAAPVIDGAVTLEVSSTLIPDGGYCPDVRVDPVRFIDAAVAYTGSPTVPRTISEFLPPVLRQLTIFVPAQPDADVVGAALALTTSVTQYYGAQTVRVVVRPDSELLAAPSDGPFERSIVLTENQDTAAELIYPMDAAPPRLFITGSEDELQTQTRLITSNVAKLAVSTKALAGESNPPAVLAPDQATLDALGVGTVTGTPTASVSLDQTRLGRSASGVSVHLSGYYSPGEGSLTASIDDRTVDVWPADDTGLLDHWIEIPNASLGRVTTLDVTVEHPLIGASQCGNEASTVTVDGSSTVESSNSSTPTPLGFGSLPQALMPKVNVSLSDNSFANVVRAVTIVHGLQRMSTRPILPTVVSVDDAVAGSDPAIVIAPNGALPESVSLPLSSTGTATFTVAGGDVLTLGTDVPYATVQVANTENDAALVVASSNDAPEQLDGLLGWLDSDPTRWFGLSGDVLFAAADIAPLSLSSTDLAGAEADAPAADNSINWLTVAAACAGGLLLLAGIVAAVLVWLRSRKHRDGRGEPTPAP